MEELQTSSTNNKFSLLASNDKELDNVKVKSDIGDVHRFFLNISKAHVLPPGKAERRIIFQLNEGTSQNWRVPIFNDPDKINRFIEYVKIMEKLKDGNLQLSLCKNENLYRGTHFNPHPLKGDLYVLTDNKKRIALWEWEYCADDSPAKRHPAAGQTVSGYKIAIGVWDVKYEGNDYRWGTLGIDELFKEKFGIFEPDDFLVVFCRCLKKCVPNFMESNKCEMFLREDSEDDARKKEAEIKERVSRDVAFYLNAKEISKNEELCNFILSGSPRKVLEVNDWELLTKIELLITGKKEPQSRKRVGDEKVFKLLIAASNSNKRRRKN